MDFTAWELSPLVERTFEESIWVNTKGKIALNLYPNWSAFLFVPKRSFLRHEGKNQESIPVSHIYMIENCFLEVFFFNQNNSYTTQKLNYISRLIPKKIPVTSPTPSNAWSFCIHFQLSPLYLTSSFIPLHNKIYSYNFIKHKIKYICIRNNIGHH